jgi:hypothetical protein
MYVVMVILFRGRSRECFGARNLRIPSEYAKNIRGVDKENLFQ